MNCELNDRTRNYKVLLFVRENNKKNKVTSQYMFLGRARYVSYSGNKRIKII
jgi:hypothetical protein